MHFAKHAAANALITGMPRAFAEFLACQWIDCFHLVRMEVSRISAGLHSFERFYRA